MTGVEMVADTIALAALLDSTFREGGDGNIEGLTDMESLLKLGLVGLFANQVAITFFSRLQPYVVAIGWEAMPQILLLANVIVSESTRLHEDEVTLALADANVSALVAASDSLVYVTNSTGGLALASVSPALTVFAMIILINAVTGVVATRRSRQRPCRAAAACGCRATLTRRRGFALRGVRSSC